MSASSYDECLRRLLVHEGGYTNNPADPGGPTNFGITIRDYRRYMKPTATAADIRKMKLAEARAIYRPKYWDALRCDDLPAGVDDAIFDYGVNSGIGRAGKVLRRLVGLPDDTGIVDTGVISAVARRDPATLIDAICSERLRFLHGLKTWPVFGAGWGTRVSEVRAFSLSLAKLPMTQIPEAEAARPKSTPPATTAKAVVARQSKVPIAGAMAGAAGLPFLDTHPSFVIGGLIVIATGVGIALAIVNNAHQSKQEAPMPGVAVVPVNV